MASAQRKSDLNNKRRSAYKLVMAVGLLLVAVGCGLLLQNYKESYNRQQFIKHQETILGSNNIPSSKKPTSQEVASYSVAPNLPKYLVIPSIHVYAKITKLYVNSQNQIEAPDNIYDTGWYVNSSLPGQAGAMFIDGHVSSWTATGVFYDLNKLRPGDTIQVVRGDNHTFTYVVQQVRAYQSDSVDMSQVLSPLVAGKPGLNIMTCAGSVIKGTSEFNQRLVVYSVLQT